MAKNDLKSNGLKIYQSRVCSLWHYLPFVKCIPSKLLLYLSRHHREAILVSFPTNNCSVFQPQNSQDLVSHRRPLWGSLQKPGSHRRKLRTARGCLSNRSNNETLKYKNVWIAEHQKMQRQTSSFFQIVEQLWKQTYSDGYSRKTSM